MFDKNKEGERIIMLEETIERLIIATENLTKRIESLGLVVKPVVEESKPLLSEELKEVKKAPAKAKKSKAVEAEVVEDDEDEFGIPDEVPASVDVDLFEEEPPITEEVLRELAQKIITKEGGNTTPRGVLAKIKVKDAAAEGGVRECLRLKEIPSNRMKEVFDAFNKALGINK